MLEPSFSIPISTKFYKNSHHSTIGEELPRPVVVDFKDNNEKYLVLVSHEPSIKIYKLGPTAIKSTKKMKDNTNGNSNSKSKSKISTPVLYKKKSLLVSMNSQKYNKIGITRGTRPVGLGVGSIKKKRKENDGNNKSSEEKIIIVVTESWQIICFDSELNTLWQVYAQSQVLPKNTIFQELTILITPHEIFEGDLGMVVVGGRVSQKIKIKQDQPEEGPNHSSHENTNDNSQKVTISKNFEYFCFAARNGKLRWKSTPAFHNAETASAYGAASGVHFVSQFKSAQINTILTNWRVFRESVLYQFPYSWRSKSDSHLRLANFQRDRSSRETKGIRYSKDKFNEKLLKEPPNALVAHVKNGIDVVHLYTGVQICYIPLTSHGSYGDLSGNFMINHIESTLSHDYIQKINQASAPQRKNDADFYTGNRHLRSKHYSADNHQFPRLSLNSKGSINWKIPICLAQANSDLIKREPIWNNTICTYSDLLKSSNGASSDSFGDGKLRISLLDPILIPDLETKYRRYLSIFAISNGNLLAVSHNGQIRWSINTNANWIANFDEDEQNPLFDQIFTPILQPFKNNILLIGKKNGLIIESTNGKIRTSFEIPNYLDSPISSPWAIVEDFNGDGISDLIIETRKAYIGFSQRQSALQSASIPAILFFFLVFYLITLAIFFYNNSPRTNKNNYRARKKKRERKSSSILNERFHM
ncbi:fg-gap repeat-containing protein [Anaeramoeba flamelloides]|uniref:Fg-gap repeat-containing protein n=1 Tax=Anaeramoeba flamelloides TaxID=1746091 RepID=A0ABQ8Y8C4_9EUKA|nr:fg-gap repeat-containing protein [Anaeramoeba flamelloides]